MATYYPTSNNQRDTVPMLYLREPLPGSYPEVPVLQGNMMMYMNYPSSSSANSDTLPVNSQQIDSNSTIPQQEILSNLGGSRIGEHEMLFMHPVGGGLQSQGLSLSLSTQIPMGIQIPNVQFRNPNQGFSSFLSPNSAIRDDQNDSLSKQSRNGKYFPQTFGNQDSMKGDSSSISRNIPNSKYLKAAQQLLDEVVNVRKALKQSDSEKTRIKGSEETAVPSNPQDSSNNSAPELSSTERQDLQNKMTKLLSILDEVDRRYKQYYHQMQIVVSSFDVIAGLGAAKPYTALALQTISRHFRCLRDSISGQIRAARKSLGEQETSGSNAQGVGISRLRYVDQQLRQQRTIQQLGMMQPHAWRPQRGLPESSVSVLRAWLFEHFLHPYPKDSDKIMLARQTGLTRSQVSNWFINARVRLWKPMVEEMYKEEIGDAELDSNSSSEHAGRPTKGDVRASEDRGEDFQQTATSKSDYNPVIEMGGPSIGGSGFQSGARGESEPEPETRSEFVVDKFRDDQRPGMDESSLFGDGLMQYHMSELGRFGGSSGISLTLGLQHCESMSGGSHHGGPHGPHHGFVAVQGGDDVYVPEAISGGPETEEFECVDPDNRQQRFASAHMLHDFVA